MPAKNHTATPQHTIEAAVKRFIAGESAAVLAKYYKVAKPTIYNWVERVKENMIDQSERQGMSPKQLAERDHEAVVLENMALKSEVTKLRNKVISLMLKAGEL